MNYELINMGAYNLHLVKTNRFKTITVEVDFRREIQKEDITKRAVLKEVLLNSNKNYRTERELIIESKNLYDLKLVSSSARMGNYTNISFKTRFLDEKYTEKNMNEESIAFLMDIIFNPNIDNGSFNEEVVNKCKNRIEKSIKSLKDSKLKYTLFKLLENVEDKPYSYNSYGYLEDLEKIDDKVLYDYYKDMINNDFIDIFVVGDFDSIEIKELIKKYFKARTYHRTKTNIIVEELPIIKKIIEQSEEDNVNQTQFTILCGINNLTEFERKYVIKVYSELLGGSSNSILFDTVREKNSYAYYVNADVKSYDNILLIYSGIEPGNKNEVFKLIKKCLIDIEKGNFTDDMLNNAKETLIGGIKASLDSPSGIINNYFAKILVGTDDFKERIENFKKVTKEDVINVSKKINIYSTYTLEGVKQDEEN